VAAKSIVGKKLEQCMDKSYEFGKHFNNVFTTVLNIIKDNIILICGTIFLSITFFTIGFFARYNKNT
jgi:hypothetical protein